MKTTKSHVRYGEEQKYKVQKPYEIVKVGKGHQINCSHCGSRYMYKELPGTLERKRIIYSVNKKINIKDVEIENIRYKKLYDTAICNICGREYAKFDITNRKIMNDLAVCSDCFNIFRSLESRYGNEIANEKIRELIE